LTKWVQKVRTADISEKMEDGGCCEDRRGKKDADKMKKAAGLFCSVTVCCAFRDITTVNSKSAPRDAVLGHILSKQKEKAGK
jgi:hypothetical protein